ncbi:MAG: caspase domain-containing protein [Promethearchaeota archaeon]
MSDRKKYAFLVGIRDYYYDVFDPVPWAVRHVKDFENILRQSGEFEEIVVLRSKDDNEKIEEYDYTSPSKPNIIKQFSELLKRMNDHDLIILYFVCHGGLIRGENYIFPEAANEESSDLGISISYFENAMKNLSAQTWSVFFFLDICQEKIEYAAGGPVVTAKQTRDHVPLDKNVVKEKDHTLIGKDEPSIISKFFACKPQFKAHCFKKGKFLNSIFSYALLEGLRDKIPMPIRYGKLVNYTLDRVEEIAKSVNKVQEPINESIERLSNPIVILEGGPEKLKRVRELIFNINEANILMDKKYGHINQLKGVLLKIEPSDIREYIGIELYDLLFKGDMQGFFEKEVEEAHNLDQFLRIKLLFENEDLYKLPWEFLYCINRKISLATSEDIIFSRYLPTKPGDEIVFHKHDPPLKILIVVSQPIGMKDTNGYEVATELAYLFEKSEKIEIELEDRPTPTRLKDRIEQNFDIIHFIGYAKYEHNKSKICLLEENREVKWITETELIKFFKSREKESLPILVVLPFSELTELDTENSVYLNIDPFAINFIKNKESKNNFPTIITFRYPLNFSETITFFQEFYKEVVEQSIIDLAVQVGRESINKSKGGNHTSRSYGAPVLYTQKYGNIIEEKTKIFQDDFKHKFSYIDEKKLDDPRRTLTPEKPSVSLVKSPQNPHIKRLIYKVIKSGNEKLAEKANEIDNVDQYHKYSKKIQDLKTEFKKISKNPEIEMMKILNDKIAEAEDDIIEEIYQVMFESISDNTKMRQQLNETEV